MSRDYSRILVWFAGIFMSITAYAGEDVGVGFVKESGETIVVADMNVDDAMNEYRCLLSADVCEQSFDEVYSEAQIQKGRTIAGWIEAVGKSGKVAKVSTKFTAGEIEIEGVITRVITREPIAPSAPSFIWIDPKAK